MDIFYENTQFWAVMLLGAGLLLVYKFRSWIGKYLLRVLFYFRIRRAEQITKAVKLSEQGKTDEALALLDRIGKRIPASLGPAYFQARGHVLENAGDLDDAIKVFTAGVLLQEGASPAYIRLAIICGKLFRNDEGKAWLDRLRRNESVPTDLLKRADDIQDLFDRIENGEMLKEYGQRAGTFLRRVLDLKEISAFSLEHAVVCERWINDNPGASREEMDDAAIFLGVLLAERTGGTWKISIDPQFSMIVPAGSDEGLRPYDLIKKIKSGVGTISDLIPG